MSKADTKQFRERKATVIQALRSENLHITENCKGLATINRLVEVTGLNEQAVKRIVNNLCVDGKVEVLRDKSFIVLLRKERK